MFFFLPLVMGFSALLDNYQTKRSMQVILLLFILLLLVGLGHSTFMRNFTWKNPKSLWIDAADKAPLIARPHHNLAHYYQGKGHYDKALFEYQKALESRMANRKNMYFTIYYNLGKLYADTKNYEKAEIFYKKALKIKPNFPALQNNLATLYDRQGKKAKAFRYLKRSYWLDPSNAVVNMNLGLFFLKKHMPDKALFHLEKSKSPELLNNYYGYMGIAFKQKGQSGKAITLFKEALRANPEDIMSSLHIAELYSIMGHPDEADKAAEKALSKMAGDMTRFHQVLHDLYNKDGMENIHPDPDVVLPLVRKTVKTMSKELDVFQ
jgi:tetratricopeptide (TPR) repeat protein